MKKLIILSAATMLFASGTKAQNGNEIAGTNNETAIKTDMKNLSAQERTIKEEKKTERKELRKLEGKEASYRSKQEFYRDFGNVPGVTWTREINFDKATFVKNGQVQKAFYDSDSKLVGTVIDKTFDDLPAKAKKTINKKYPDYNIGKVILFDDNELNETDMVLYNQQFDDADNYFIEMDKDGKQVVLQSTTDGDVDYFATIK